MLASWVDIADDFAGGLVLGNGASIAVDTEFAYSSLLAAAQERCLVTAVVAEVFRGFKTSDFEYVLRLLWHANLVNRALKIGEHRTKLVYNATRDALIKIVRAIHPSQAEVRPTLLAGLPFLQHHRIIANLNYDLLIYWTMLLGNESQTEIRFKDGFVDEGRFRYDWCGLVEPIRGTKRSILVFHPHGNLMLGIDQSGQELKLARGGAPSDLLQLVFASWEQSGYRPLIVSEGTSAEKLARIGDSRYLGRVYESVLPRMGEAVTIYGASLGAQDAHILKAILAGGTKRLAVSVFATGEAEAKRTVHRLQVEVDEAAKTVPQTVDVTFFDACSKGAWVY